MAVIKILTIDDEDLSYKVIDRQVEQLQPMKLTEHHKAVIKELLQKFVDTIINENRVDEELFLQLVELSPRPNDSEILNTIVREAQVAKSYRDDFDEDVDFPVDYYYQELTK